MILRVIKYDVYSENYSCASSFIYSSLLQSLEKMVAGKKHKPLLVVVAQSFPMVAIIAFPVQIAQFVGK